MTKNREVIRGIQTTIKAIKQYSYPIDNSDYKEFCCIAQKYSAVNNYVYSRYSGINSLLLLSNYKKEIRDPWVKSRFCEQFNLPARYWKLALDDAIGNIKSNWSNIKNRVRQVILKNPNLTEDEVKYLCYIIKVDALLYSVLTRQSFNKPKTIAKLDIRENYIHNLLRRYIRKYKGKVPYTYKKIIFK